MEKFLRKISELQINLKALLEIRTGIRDSETQKQLQDSLKNAEKNPTNKAVGADTTAGMDSSEN